MNIIAEPMIVANNIALIRKVFWRESLRLRTLRLMIVGMNLEIVAISIVIRLLGSGR